MTASVVRLSERIRSLAPDRQIAAIDVTASKFSTIGES